MQELTNKNHLVKLSFLYTFLIIILICIPAYFYMQGEIKNYKFNQTNLLNQYGLNIQRAIYDFNSSKSNIFHFPKSFSFEAKLLDKNNNLIYATNTSSNSDKITKTFGLDKNRLEAAKLLISQTPDYKEIYLKISVLTLSIGLFIFISAYMILKQSIIPYKKANKYLDRFFNDAMHELKTPLGILQLNLEILDEKLENTKELNRSLNAIKTLLLTYDDIEYLMKQKRVSYTKESVDFSSFLNQRVELFESLATSKKIELEKEIEDNINFEINRIELQRVIDNTISNAIKYSDEASKIIINLKKENNQIIFSVKDFGKGIKDKEKIFYRYHREESIKGGFGIGLNIVKNICDKNNIKIEVTSKQNQGSIFTYYFS